jgi:predicted GNAT family N-acyltransferase
MAIRIIDHGSKEYQKMVELRKHILRKPLGLDFTEQELAEEKDQILIGCFDDEKIEGCCMLVKQDKHTVRLRQMAVLSGLQGNGLGRVIMEFAENIARDNGYTKMVMHARKTATGFYEKLGYSIKGDEFMEVSIPHYTMEKAL